MRQVLVWVMVVGVWLMSAPAQAQPPAPRPRDDAPSDGLPTPAPRRALRDSVVWRIGPSFHAMFGSGQGRPLTYPTLAVRYKVDEIFFDAQLPIVFGGMDAAQYYARKGWLDSNAAFNLFEALNDTPQYAYIEGAQARFGRTFQAALFARDDEPGLPVRLTLGALAFAELVIFEARLLGAPLEDLDETIGIDPLVVGVGAFSALGVALPSSELDLSLSLARDVASQGDYTPRSGWIISSEIDAQIDIYGDWGMFARWRVSAYTHPDDGLAWTTGFSTGVAFRLF